MSERLLDKVRSALTNDRELFTDFIALCDCGGRRAGTASEERGIQIAHARLAAIHPGASLTDVPYAGWRSTRATLALAGGASLTCNSLLGAQSTSPGGIEVEVVDLGRGTEEDFARYAHEIAGRALLVRHEYPFSAVHIHRRRKYNRAIELNAAAFIIANPLPQSGQMSGSSGRGGGAGIPAIATDYESAALLARRGDRLPRVRLELIGEDYAATTSVIALDLPGKTDARVALTAHIDGHDLAESAMDNATGVAVVLAVARAFAPHVAQCERGLRVCFFSAEEWALAGSREYLDRMSEAERARIALNINLDTVGGDAQFTALTSEFPRLGPFVQETAAAQGLTLGTYAPMMSNSDHYNFARHGIPAFRLVAGFDNPESNIRHILTRGDTREKVEQSELVHASQLTAALLARALTMSAPDIAALRLKS